jgi:DNA-binding MarR family transcriptional regulator
MARKSKAYSELDALGLVENICACHVLRKATRLTTQVYDHHLRASGLTIAQFSLLSMLYHTAPIPMKTLARRMGNERTTLTRNLHVLRRMGYVEVLASDENDARTRNVEITEAGTAALAAALPLWREAQDLVVGSLGEEGWDRLRASLRQATKVAQKAL